MSSRRPPAPPPAAATPTSLRTAAALLALAAVAAYANSFSGPFVYDDESSILSNPTLRHLWPPWDAFLPPPHGLTVSGRPVLNFSLALNRAISGTDVWSYHALNLLFHTLAGLTLFGLVRRTLLQPLLAARFGRDALPLAFVVALLWTVHPLQTESVTYVIQRGESLCGLFYLLTLYGFVRGTAPDASPRWRGLAVAACALGMATKEVMATAPLLVLLYDRTFVAGSVRAALRQRGRWHGALAATWLVVAACVATTGGNRGGAVGFGTGVAWWTYGVTQFEAITRYLTLAVWPQPLVFDYGPSGLARPAELLPHAIIVVLLLAATGLAFWRRTALGFAGVVFFAILSPTSLVPGTTQMIVEHRVYLSLAAVLAVAVLALHRWHGRRALPVWLAVALLFVFLTHRRNADYRSALALWQDTVAKRPANALAHHNLGVVLLQSGAAGGALDHFAAAVRLNPGYDDARQNLATTFLLLGRAPEAIAEFQQLLARSPDAADAHSNLGLALLQADRIAESVAHGRAAVRLRPDSAEIHFNLANALTTAGELADADAEYHAALRLAPDHGLAHFCLGNALRERDPAAAADHYARAVRLLPDFAPARRALAGLRAGPPAPR